MSIKDITDYVRQTPGNTNPSVIRSMVEREVENGQKDVVKYTPQSLTEEQQAQARANIGVAAASGNVFTPVYSVSGETVLDEEFGMPILVLEEAPNILPGRLYRVVYDGEVYDNILAIPLNPDEVEGVSIGDASKFGTAGALNCVLGIQDGVGMWITTTEGAHSISVYLVELDAPVIARNTTIPLSLAEEIKCRALLGKTACYELAGEWGNNGYTAFTFAYYCVIFNPELGALALMEPIGGNHLRITWGDTEATVS